MRLPEQILVEKVVPVVRGLTPERANALTEALAAGGLTTIEITLESPDGIAAIAALQQSTFTVGAGTVMNVAQAETAVDAGASFLVSPHLDRELLEWGLSSAVPYIPGVLSPSELASAVALGATTVKLFPASVGGPDMVGALLAPFPHVHLIPTGGITAGNAAAFLAKGAVAVGVGGWLTDHSDLAVVSDRARALAEVV